ncbi:WD repeat-containing protein 70-like [Liolophura sinensis]|uniref:WD repeat-containing protein 70-like n=1 Tax=Liolophura sinensis TaxID=3198878 RepID=UPI0031590363
MADKDPTQDGSKKKARTFDFMAMFEEAKKTAMERSQPSLDEDKEDTVKTGKGPSSSSSSGSDSESDSGSDSSVSEDEMIGPPLPPGTKPAQKATGRTEAPEDDMVGPPLPPGFKAPDSSGHTLKRSHGKSVEGGRGQSGAVSIQRERGEDEDEDGDSEEEEEEGLTSRIPESHETELDHGDKTVSALALDPSGARLVTGGFDYNVKFWDFAGMDSSFKSFRQLRPCECHQIKTLEYSPTGEVILVVAGNSQAKVIDRDGFEKMECVKGDQYLVDMASTKGHTAMLNSGCWNPKIKEEFLTCANDGTVRLWDVNQERKHKNIIKTKSQQGRKTIPTTCTYSNDGRYVAAACQDGSIQIWEHSRFFVNVALKNRNAHMNGSDTSSLKFSYDGKVLASRGGDDTLKLWDIRNFKQPLRVKQNLCNYFPMTDCLFSPDDRLVVTGLSVKKNEAAGKLVFLDRETLDIAHSMDVTTSSVVRCVWHPKLNQIVVGCGNGKVKLYYDPKKSQRGAMLCVVKTKRKTKHVEVMADKHIITPYALPMYREGRPTSTRKTEEKLRKDPVKSRRPELPVTGPGEGGRVGAKGATLSQYVVQQLVLRKPDAADKDPRNAILRHAKEASENPYWIAPAYARTQPKAIFQEEEEEEEEETDTEPLWKKAKLTQ